MHDTDTIISADAPFEEELEIARPEGRVRRLVERGLTTVEYAIGLLAAAALALVLLRIFNDNQFFQTMFDWVVGIFGKVADLNGGSFTDLLSAIFG